MNETKSSIDSFNVSMGNSSMQNSDASFKSEPWNILICSDLGFTSKKPSQVNIAEWNEFMESCNICISGAVEGITEASGKSLYIEYPVLSIKDFLASNIQEKASVFAGTGKTINALTRLVDGSITVNEAVSIVKNASLGQQEKDLVMGMLVEKHASPLSAPAPASTSLSINKILSMVDTGRSENPADSTDSATQALLSSISADSIVNIDKNRIRTYINSSRTKLAEQLLAFQNMPFFAQKKASWLCLQQCAKLVGRKKEIRLFVFSAPQKKMEEAVSGILAECINSRTIPDIIVWDYAFSFTNANMESALSLATAADGCKSMTIAPLSVADRFFANIEKTDSLAQKLSEPVYLPFKKLQADAVSRCLCLCGPDITIESAKPENNSPNSISAGGCWPAIIRWIESVIFHGNPFAVPVFQNSQESALSCGASFSHKIPSHISQEATSSGLSIFSGSPASATPDCIITAIDQSVAGSAYSSFSFNLLINRIARLAAMRITENASTNKKATAQELKLFLTKELEACHIKSSQELATVKVNADGGLDISINSDLSAGGVEAKFTFSLDF